MYCKHLSKSLNGKLRCKLFKTITYINECQKCLKFELRKNEPIKKVSKKRIFVKEEIYNQVFKRDKGKCRLCGSINTQLHHIIYRSENKSLINDPSNCIMLCINCHKLVHSNKHKWQPILKEVIKGEYNRKNNDF